MAPKTILLILHILGVICGVGGVLMLDTHLLRHLRGATVTSQDVKFTHFVSAFVKAGLIVVWATGLMIIAAAPDGPASVLANPKLQAKLVVVVVLTINALFVETLALPLIVRNVGKPLFDGVSQIRRSFILGCGAVSTLSWLYPIVLGLARELNQVTPAQLILTCYATLLVALAVSMQVAGRILYRPRLQADLFSPSSDEAGGAEKAAPQRKWVGDVAVSDVPSSAGKALDLAYTAGCLALHRAVAPDQVIKVFATLATEKERHQFRVGLFRALHDQFGQDMELESLVSKVANDKAMRTKIASIAPDPAAFDANMEEVLRGSDLSTWSKVQEWHETLMGLNARAPVAGAAPDLRTAAAI